MKDIIKQPFHLTTSSNSYNIHQMRVLTNIVKSLQNEMVYGASPASTINDLRAGKILEFKVKDLMIEGSKNYKALRNALDSLLNSEIYMRGVDKNKGNYELKTHLISEYKYFAKNEYVEVCLSRGVLAYILSIAKYTKFSFSLAFNLSSAYTVKLYQYISHWSDKPSGQVISISTKLIKERLMLGDKYKRPAALKQIILSPAQKELKAKADVWFEIKEPIKEGRKVTGWKIQIFKREEPKKAAQPKKQGKDTSPQPLQFDYKMIK